MHPFAFWLSVGLSAGHVIFYGLVLMVSLCIGWHGSMDGLPAGKVLLIGWCDSISSICGLTSAAALSGPTVVALSQSLVPLLLLLSDRRRTASLAQSGTAAVVVVGIYLAVGPHAAEGDSPHVAMALTGFVFSAISLTIKQRVFRDHPHLASLGVTFLSGLAQLTGSLLLFPLISLSVFGAIPLRDLLGYHHAGWRCSLGAWLPDGIYPVAIAHHTTDCSMMPAPLLVHFALTVAFSGAALWAAHAAGPCSVFASATLALMLQYAAFAVDWPLLPRTAFSGLDIIGFILIVLGVVGNYEAARRQEQLEAWQALKPQPWSGNYRTSH
eukprot:EG_transcript_14219